MNTETLLSQYGTCNQDGCNNTYKLADCAQHRVKVHGAVDHTKVSPQLLEKSQAVSVAYVNRPTSFKQLAMMVMKNEKHLEKFKALCTLYKCKKSIIDDPIDVYVHGTIYHGKGILVQC